MPPKMTNEFRGEIASCSVGTEISPKEGERLPYNHPHNFFSTLEEVLKEWGYEYEDFQYTTIYTNEGRGRLSVIGSPDGSWDNPPFEVAFQWHRYPSGNWEFNCYPTC